MRSDAGASWRGDEGDVNLMKTNEKKKEWK
jgi:hypothetical protein